MSVLKNKCRCGEEIIWGYQCHDCRIKEERWVFGITIAIILLFFGVAFGVRLIWANIVFDDWRCALSECRIIK